MNEFRVHIAFCLQMWCPINSQTGWNLWSSRSSEIVIWNIFLHAVSKLAQFTPFSSINIPSKWELLIISAKFLPLYCASIDKSSLVKPYQVPNFPLIFFWLNLEKSSCQCCRTLNLPYVCHCWTLSLCVAVVWHRRTNSWVAVYRCRTGTFVTAVVVMPTALITVKLNYIYIVWLLP